MRESLSATMDGEQPAVPVAVIDQHVASCAGCQQWRQRAEAISRQARISQAPALEDLAHRVIVVVREEAQPRAREWRAVRVAICLVAVLQLALTIPILILGHDREAPLHVSHEMGSWDAAVALGLLLAVRRPARADGAAAVIGVGAAVLCITAIIDLVAGRTTVSDEAPHLLCVAGWLLLHRLAVLNRLRPPGSTPSTIRGAEPIELDEASSASLAASDGADEQLPDVSARGADLSA